jgi:hypothetical protein
MLRKLIGAEGCSTITFFSKIATNFTKRANKKHLDDSLSVLIVHMRVCKIRIIFCNLVSVQRKIDCNDRSLINNA